MRRLLTFLSTTLLIIYKQNQGKDLHYPADSFFLVYSCSYFNVMWSINLCRFTRFDEGEVHVYCVSGVPDIFTHVGRSTNASDEADYYGILTDIIQIEYEGAVNLKITLFKCKWYDPMIGRGTRRSNGGIVDVLSSRKYYKYEPFILGTYVLFIHIN